MAKRAAALPTWVQSLDAMVAGNCHVRVMCDRCREWRDVDLAALRERVGGDYSLKSRLTAGCSGWNTFRYLHGVYRPLWDRETLARWSAE